MQHSVNAILKICNFENLIGSQSYNIIRKKNINTNYYLYSMGLFTLMKKKTLHYAKILTTCQNFSRISYIVIKIWQQTKYSYFFGNLPKFGKVGNNIKVNSPYNKAT